MLPPYDTEEVAQAIAARFTQAGIPPDVLHVQADAEARQWLLAVRLPDGEVKSTTVPFSEPAGINTPAELAEIFVTAVADGGG